MGKVLSFYLLWGVRRSRRGLFGGWDFVTGRRLGGLVEGRSF
jgi:hypothetical protein